MQCAIALAFVLSAVPAFAREWMGFPADALLIVRLEGHFANDRKAARASGPDVLSVRIDGRERWLTVDRAVTVGDHPLSGRAVLNLLAPLQSNLTIVGSTQLRERLASAPDGAPVRFEGLVEGGSRTLLLRDVQVDTAPPT